MINQLLQNIESFPDRVAFVINDSTFTYKQFGEKISAIKHQIDAVSKKYNEPIGVITRNDLETYASIYAIWLSAKCFVPINPALPLSRNKSIIDQANIEIVITSTDVESTRLISEFKYCIYSSISTDLPINLLPASLDEDDLMYILFTSGSTGIPKGVPINRRNLNAFVINFVSNGCDFSHTDRFLQMFDFTFDVSVLCYTVPLYVGASIYTVPLDNIKFLSIYQILDKHQVTVAMVVPSVVSYLRPYFQKITLPHLRYSMFTGEALTDRLVAEWESCVPNALIQNYYGPTEATIDCIVYDWKSDKRADKSYNGVVSIGKPFGDTIAIVLSEAGEVISDLSKGELCLSGNQVASGYFKLEEKTLESFVWIDYCGEKRFFYRTGDLVYRDQEGDIMYCGRIDSQVQVQGYRVELGELECHAKQIVGNVQVAAIARNNEIGNTLLYLFVERCAISHKEFSDKLQDILPYYMIPFRVIFEDQFPITPSGKIDRKKLLSLID